MDHSQTQPLWGGPDGMYQDPYSATSAQPPILTTLTAQETKAPAVTETTVSISTQLLTTIVLPPYTTRSVYETHYITISTFENTKSATGTALDDSSPVPSPATTRFIATIAGEVFQHIIITVTVVLETPSVPFTLSLLAPLTGLVPSSSSPSRSIATAAARTTTASGWKHWTAGHKAGVILGILFGFLVILFLCFVVWHNLRRHKGYTQPDQERGPPRGEETQLPTEERYTPRSMPDESNSGLLGDHSRRQERRMERANLSDSDDDEGAVDISSDSGNRARRLASMPVHPEDTEVHFYKQRGGAERSGNLQLDTHFMVPGASEGLRKRSGDQRMGAENENILVTPLSESKKHVERRKSTAERDGQDADRRSAGRRDFSGNKRMSGMAIPRVRAVPEDRVLDDSDSGSRIGIASL